MSRGFTLIELVICLAIFGIMTALVVAEYGNFNQSTLLTDTAYDIALVLHTAQSYGLSVKDVGTGVVCNGGTGFDCAYGVDFSSSSGGDACGTPSSNATNISLFANTGSTADVCGSGDTLVTSYAVTHGAKISNLCAASSPAACSGGSGASQLDVTFLRPNPDATICATTSGVTSCSSYGQITLQGTDGSLRTVSIYQNGQIVVNQ